MSSGTLSGIVTAISMIAFLGVVVWAYSTRRKTDFDQAASLPLDDEDSEVRR